MKKLPLRSLFGAFVLLICSASLNASPHAKQDLIPAEHWVYDSLTALALEEGHVSLADQAPLSVGEILALLQDIQYETLSDAGKKVYDKILSFMKEENWSFNFAGISLGTDPSVSFSVQAKSDEVIDWTYNRFYRKPLIAIPMRLQLRDFLTINTTFPVSENKTAMSHHINFTNVPFSIDDFDINFPHDAYASAGYLFSDSFGVNVYVSQLPSSIGRSLSGSAKWSPYMTDITSVNFSVFSPRIRFTTNVTQLNVDRYYYTHHLEFNIAQKVSVSIMESMLIASDFELRFLNPFIIFHNFSPWQDYKNWAGWSDTCAASFCALSFSYAPVPHLLVYTHLVMDQFQMPNERSETDIIPNGLGVQLGAESFIPYRDGYLHFWLEGYYATPFLFIKEQPVRSRFHTYTETIPGAISLYEWIGSPFGPDTAAGQVKVSYEIPQEWTLSLSYLFAARGENASSAIFTNADVGGRDFIAGDDSDGKEDLSNWVYPLPGDTTKRDWVAPHGIVEFEHRLTASFEWNICSGISFFVQPSFVILANAKHEQNSIHAGIEGAASVTVSLPQFISSLGNKK